MSQSMKRHRKKPLTVIYGGDTDFLAVKVTPPTLSKQELARLA